MFSAGKPSLFGAMPLLKLNQTWGRNRNVPYTMRGLLHEVLGNGISIQDLWGMNQPNFVDNSGRQHCRTHCYGHISPEDLLEQFIIENAMKDTHQTSDNDNGHRCKNVSSESNESKTTESEDKEKQIDKHVEVVPQSSANDTVAYLSAPWSISVDMNGCDEVRARIEENKIVVEGQTHSTEGFLTVKRVMTLPSHVKGEALTASLGRNGTLTLTEMQASKVNQDTDIPVVSKENIIQIRHTGQSENEMIQDDIVRINKLRSPYD